ARRSLCHVAGALGGHCRKNIQSGGGRARLVFRTLRQSSCPSNRASDCHRLDRARLHMFRKFIVAVVIVVALEGAIRKWVLPEYGTEVFLVEDFILAFAFAAYIGSQHEHTAMSDLSI